MEPAGRKPAAAFLRFGVAPGVATLLAIAAFVVQAPELVSAAAHGCVAPGNDGPNPALTGIVNTYYPATASAAAGATTISVGARIPGGSPDIAAGDLLLVIQMQDADISDTNTVAYGDGATGRGYTAINSTGKYEYVRATGAVGAIVAGAVGISGSGAGAGLVNSYDFSTTVSTVAPIHGFRTFQVVRVPQYSSATVTTGLTAAAWDGAVHAGGVLAVDVAGVLNLNSQTISVDQLGFKGALGAPQAGPANGATGTDYVVPSLNGQHGYKGEGIAGTPRFLYDAIAAAPINGLVDGYPKGDAARGAPGNAGGGGTDADPALNDQNSGGGGGGNGGQGGGGGNSWNTNLPVGGLGGAAFPAFPAAANRVVLGGGGGAGTRNNSSGVDSSGGTGGGIVMIRAGSVGGTGTISADGGVGVTPQNDGGGGGGAGGSVVVSSVTGTVGGLTIRANGGQGTDAWPTDAGGARDYHGPGGGGAGGVIITSSAPLSTSVLGGVHGTTTTDHNAYGSTDGAAGLVLATTPGSLPGSSSGAECLPVLTVTKTTSTPNVTNTGGTTATYSITVGNAINTAAATGITISDALPAGFSYASTGAIALNGGSARPATVNPSPGDPSPAFGTFTIPAGGSVVITFTVNIASTVPNGTYNNPATATYLDPTRTAVSGTTSSGYPGGGVERVTVGLPADIAISKTVSNTGPNQNTNVTFTITATNIGPGNATGVQVTDLLPAGLTLISATPSAGTTYASGTGVWNIGALANGAHATLSIVAKVTVTTPVTNTATKTAEDQSDPDAENNSASATVSALPGLPNTSAPLGPGGGPTAPEGTSGISLAALGMVAGMGAIGVAAICSGRNRSRFRRRRSQVGISRGPGERIALGGSTLIAGLVLGVISSSQLGAFAQARLTPPTAVVNAPVTSAAGLLSDTQMIGSTLVTTTPPAVPAAESFHLVTGPIIPARLRIPSIGVDARVYGMGLGSDGSMAVPDNLWTSAWLSTGPRPGQAGNAVIAGHRGISTPGLFGHLEGVRVGDLIYLSDATGGELVFEVTRIASLDLSRATQVAVFGPTPVRELVLVTCYGKYLARTGTDDHRLVVFSRLVPPGS
ncbi:MAG: sortase [Candidatus Dormiibacterota bacterium]